uniref:Mitochondrial import inner membrane translocase subunit TIM22 n=1 Tax=Hemiselmis tepida TaxID=464990 RepID=A0A7S0VA57_9CRYP|mmetsp:Transcript_13507/g.34617  ORF Transcript_13507/g.34617 Transcript_13507/m.34617 type:complete len:124 (+) Transcript_13507:3-374(+)
MMLGAFLAPFDTLGGLKVAENATAKETAMATLRQTAGKSTSMGRTFAVIGAVYAGSECVIEKYRAKTDMRNSAYAGCLTGGILARSGGPLAMTAGCAGFAAWSTAIESFMHSSAGEGVMGGHK